VADRLRHPRARPAARTGLVPRPVCRRRPGALPDTLDAFLAWRLSDAAPEAAWDGVSLTATGPAEAPLMVLVDCPDRDDGEAGQILSGAAGRLFDRMLAAIGQSRETVHLASVCARRPLAGRTPAGLEARLAEISPASYRAGPAAFAAPAGQCGEPCRARDRTRPARADICMPLTIKAACQAVASFHPRFLIEKPMAKAESWKDLQRLMGDMRA
jgi:DNA polymerase